MTFTKTAYAFQSYAHVDCSTEVSEQEHTLSAINDAILNDKTLSEHAKHALIELMRVAYEEVIKNSAP
jgi:hypothetical protein